MRRGQILTLLVAGTFVLSGGRVLAQTSLSPQSPQGMMPMMLHFPSLLMRAQSLAPDKAKGALRELSEKRLPAFMRQMTEVRIAWMALKSRLSDPTASDKEIEAAFQKLAQEEAKLKELNRQALLELRNALGAETFAKLFSMPMMGMMPMMQMHQRMPMMMQQQETGEDEE